MQENEITLFEIPIYSMSENEFNNSWEKERKQLFKFFMNSSHTEESARQIANSAYYPQWLWRYNQIVGYIKVSVTKSDVNLDLYCIICNRYYAKSKKKHYIVDWGLNGTHFNVIEKSNKYIKKEILSWIKSIEKEYFKQKYYIDYSTFDNIFDYVNVKEIVEKL